MVRVGRLITEDDVLIILSLLMRTLHFLASEAPNTRFVCKRVKLRTPYNEKMGVGQRLLWRRFPSKDQASEDGRTWDLPKCGLIEDALVSSQNFMIQDLHRLPESCCRDRRGPTWAGVWDLRFFHSDPTFHARHNRGLDL